MINHLSRSFEESIAGLKMAAEQSFNCGNNQSFDSMRFSRQNPMINDNIDCIPQRKEKTWDSPEQEKSSTVSEQDYLGQIDNGSSDANLLNYSDSKAAIAKLITITATSKSNRNALGSLL